MTSKELLSIRDPEASFWTYLESDELPDSDEEAARAYAWANVIMDECRECCDQPAPVDIIATGLTRFLRRFGGDALANAVDICGFCGKPGADKIPHPNRWPGEEMAGTEFVHAECETTECTRAHALLTVEQRTDFLQGQFPKW